jgi:hypothetical protein
VFAAFHFKRRGSPGQQISSRGCSELAARLQVPRMRLPVTTIHKTWWPLAASWLLMAMEMPALSAVMARLPNPEINLAAWGGVVFPVSLIIEAPIIMLLAASTALSKDMASYRWLRRFTLRAGAVLTLAHILIAFTPLFDLVVAKVIGAPQEILEASRLGLKLMTPWTFSIAYRRFNQGALIRFGHPRAVSIGTAIRLLGDGLVLTAGLLIGTVPGIAVAGAAVALGVICEAVYSGVRVCPVVKDELPNSPIVEPPLQMRAFLDFYIPLGMTSLLTLLVLPLGSAALSRMPQALASLAVWPVVSGFIFMLRSMGVAYNEVVVALLDESGAVASLQRFAAFLASAATTLLILLAATPLSSWWFETVSGLPPNLAEMARRSVWFALPLPAFNVYQSWYQGILLHTRKTRGITEAIAISLAVSLVVLTVGVRLGTIVGLYVGWSAFSLGGLAQMFWLRRRCRSALKALHQQV